MYGCSYKHIANSLRTSAKGQMLAVFTLLAVAAASIRGVPPEKQHLYQPDASNMWLCLSDASIKISFDQINDDFCDCPDGSDEPATNACSPEASQPFYCANKGYFPAYIDSFKLNDGVCDYDVCCDGSDEWRTGECPDRCPQVRAQFDHYVESRRKDVATALKTRQRYVEKARELKQTISDKYAALEAEIAGLGEQISVQEAKLAQATEAARQAALESQNEVSVVAQLMERAIEKFPGEESAEMATLRKGLTSETLEKVSNEFKQWLVSHGVVAGELDSWTAVRASLEEHVTVGAFSFVDLVHDAFVRLTGGSQGVVDIGDVDHLQDKYVSEDIERIERTVENLRKDIKSKTAEASIYKDNLNKVFGKDDILRAVDGESVSRRIGEYVYKIGFLDSILQDNILIGRATAVGETSIHYAHGAKCWNGPQRSAVVDLVCAKENRLVSVNEPEKCHYRFLVESPIVCTEMTDDDIAKTFSVDPSLL